MKKIILFLIIGVLFSKSEIKLYNLQSIIFEDGGFVFCPTFNEAGDVLAIEKWKGSDGLQTWLIDLNKIENKFPIKKSNKSKKPLHCGGIKWSKAHPDIAFIEAILGRKTRFYQLNYRNLLAQDKTYMDEWSDNIFGISSIGNEIHSYSLAEYGGEDIVIFCYHDKEEKKDRYGMYSDGAREILLPELEDPFVQMEINNIDDGYLSLIKTDSANNPEIILLEDPIDDVGTQVKISPYQYDQIVYEKKININTSDYTYLSYLAKETQNKKEKVASLYLVEDPFANTKGKKIAESVHIVDKGTERLLNFNHQWHPEHNIVFYIKRQQDLNDKFVLYAYDVENEMELAVTSDLEGIQHLAISADGKKIALCGIKSGSLWIGDLIIN